MKKPLAIDLYCGLGGWTDGLLAEGYDVIGFDIEKHEYGDHAYPAQLVLQDVRTLHGSQFRNADLIVASPPCQEYSYMAMPWSRAKQIAKALKGKGEFPKGYTGSRIIDELNELFNACFRIQREASAAAGKHIPMVVENVRGAQPWVGRAQWNFGSYYLWGDTPALMPIIPKRAVMKDGIAHRSGGASNFHRDLDNGRKNPGFRFDGSGKSFQSESVERHTPHPGYKSAGMNWSDQSKRGQDFTRIAGEQAGVKNGDNGSWFGKYEPLPADHGHVGVKQGGDWFNADMPSISRRTSSKSKARKAASAMIAKIPFELSRHIAAVYKPEPQEAAA